MQYEYTNENSAPVRVSMTYADLKALKRVLEFKAKVDKLEWSEKDLLAQTTEALRRAAESLQVHFDYELNYALKQEDNNDA